MDESLSEKFFSNSSKKNTQSKLKDAKNSINCVLFSPKDLTTITGRLNLFAKTLAVTDFSFVIVDLFISTSIDSYSL